MRKSTNYPCKFSFKTIFTKAQAYEVQNLVDGSLTVAGKYLSNKACITR